MRGISARSLEEVLGSVAAHADSDTGPLGDELFAVVGVLDATPALRRVLTDPSTEADAKAQLAAKVFGGKISSPARNVVEVAVKGRWASARDLSDGLETAGVTAHVIAADTAGELDVLEDGLFEFAEVVHGDAKLREVLTDRTIPAAPKVGLTANLLDGTSSGAVSALAKQAVVARTGSFEKTIKAFALIAAKKRDRLLAIVRVAYELGDEERTRLVAALGSKYGREVHINIIVDPDVLGGISVSVGDELIDGTVSSRLEDARRRIAG